MSGSKPPPVYLSRAEHEVIYAQIRDQYLSGAPPQRLPQAVFLAGQPGAGKSQLQEMEGERLGGPDNYVLVNIDHLREFHPDYARLMKADDRSAADRVQPDVAAWGDRLIRDAADKQRHILVDGTLKTPANARSNFSYLRERGYTVDVHALGVREADSRLGTYFRYEAQKRETGVGRWVDLDEQAASAAGLVETLRRCEREGLADRLRVSARKARRGDLEVVYDSGLARNGPSDAAAAVTAERTRVLSPKERHERAEAHADLMTAILARDPDLKEPENRSAADDAKQAFAEAPHFEVPSQVGSALSRASPGEGSATRSLADRFNASGAPSLTDGFNEAARDNRDDR